MNDPRADIATMLREVPVPPSRITTDHALSLGRKAMRRRRHGIATGAAIALVAATAGGFALIRPASSPLPSSTQASPSPSAPVDYTRWSATPVPLNAETSDARIVTMDSSGRYLLGWTSAYRAVVWDNLVPRKVPLAPGPSDQVVPIDVNASGIVIGNGTRGSTAWMYRDGVSTNLAKPLEGGPYQVRDINDRGEIVGWSERAGTIVWSAASPGATPRKVSGVDEPFSIGEDGSIGGSIGDGTHPVVVGPDGQPRRLAENPGKAGGKVFHLSGDWACGWVAADTKSNWMAARWRLSTGELTPFPDAQSNCTGLSDSGAMLSARDSAGPGILVTPDGTLVDMPAIAYHLRAISADADTIAGNISDPNGANAIPTLWRRTG